MVVIRVKIFHRLAVLWSVSLDPPFFLFISSFVWRRCRYRGGSASFGSKVSLSDGVGLWDESVPACVW